MPGARALEHGLRALRLLSAVASGVASEQPATPLTAARDANRQGLSLPVPEPVAMMRAEIHPEQRDIIRAVPDLDPATSVARVSLGLSVDLPRFILGRP